MEGPSTPLVPTPVVSNPQKEPEQNPETSTEKVQNPNLENTAHVPPPEEEESIFMEIPKPKAKKTVNVEIQDLNSPRPIPSKLPYPERMKVRENDKPSAQHSRFLKMFKQLRLEIGLKDALVEMPKFNKWLSSLLRNKEKLEEIAITTVNAECSAIIMNKVPEKLEDPGKFLIPCALQELNRTSALADSGASINLLPHSIYKKLGLEALTPTRMTLELANRSITHPMGIAEDVVVRVDGFTFLADFVVVNFEPDPRVPIILGRPFLRTAKALIDLYEETLTLRVGKEELVYYADKSEKNKDKNFVHAISIIDFSKDDPFSGSTTNTLPPSSSLMKTSDNFEKFADELAPLDSLPPGNDDSTLKKDLHEENFQVYSNPLFEFDDNFKSSNVNPLFEENDKDVEIKSSSSFILTSPEESEFEAYLEKDSIPPGIDLTLPPTLEVSSSNPTSPTLTGEKVCSWKMSMFFSLVRFVWKMMKRNSIRKKIICLLATYLHQKPKPLSRPQEVEEIKEKEDEIDSTFDEFSLPRLPKDSKSEYSDATIESLSPSPIPVEDSDPFMEEIDIFLASNDSTPPGFESDYDSEGDILLLEELLNDDLVPLAEYNHFTFDVEPDTSVKNDFDELNEDECFDPGGGENVVFLNVEEDDSFTFTIRTFLPFVTYPESHHEPEQNESSITFSLRSDPLHLEFVGELLTLPARNDREFEEYLSLVTVWISQKSPENRQKQANTDTRIRRVQKEAKESKPKPEMPSLSQKKSKDGQTKSTQKDKSSEYFTLVPQLSQKSKNVPSSLIGPRKAYWA
ncbi:reverse transcriptase domain-containing protein [Tanacetum coccineum]